MYFIIYKMIIEQKKKGTITEYIVDKDYDDNKLDKILNHKLKPSQINKIIDEDADVYTKEGKLLLRFLLPFYNCDTIVIRMLYNLQQERPPIGGRHLAVKIKIYTIIQK